MLRWPSSCSAILLGSVLGSLIAPVPILAQVVPVTRLERPTASYSTPFSHLIGLRELPDGRFLVGDRIETSVRLIDLAITALNVPPIRPQVGGGYVSGPVPPYRPSDTWAVDPAGRVAVVRHAPYRVEWFLPGQPRPVVGPTVAVQPVRVGRAEREAYLDRLMGSGGFTVMQGGQGQAVRPPRPNPNDLDWPATLPPFEGPARIGPHGEVWVKRNQPASVERVRYDLFDGQGRLIRQVELPPGRHLAGLGDGTVYVVRQDENGLQWLERYAFRLPAS